MSEPTHDHTNPLFAEPPAPVAVPDVPPNAKRTRAPRTRTNPLTAAGAGSGSADKPPRVRAPRGPRNRNTKPVVDADAYGKKLLPWYGIAGLIMPRVVGQDGGELFVRYTPMMAASWGPLAAENEAVRALIDKLSESSAVLGVVMAHIAVAGAIMAAKGAAPAELGAFAEMMASGAMPAPGTSSGGGAAAQDAPPPVPQENAA